MKETIDAPTMANDVIWGAKNIGKEIGQTTRQAFHMLENGYLPGRKVGKRWCSWRSRLREAISPQRSEVA